MVTCKDNRPSHSAYLQCPEKSFLSRFSRQTPEDGKGPPSQDPESWKRKSSCMVGMVVAWWAWWAPTTPTTPTDHSDQMLIPRWRGLLLLTLQGTPYCVPTPSERGSYVFFGASLFSTGYCSPVSVNAHLQNYTDELQLLKQVFSSTIEPLIQDWLDYSYY